MVDQIRFPLESNSMSRAAVSGNPAWICSRYVLSGTNLGRPSVSFASFMGKSCFPGEPPGSRRHSRSKIPQRGTRTQSGRLFSS